MTTVMKDLYDARLKAPPWREDEYSSSTGSESVPDPSLPLTDRAVFLAALTTVYVTFNWRPQP